MKKAKQIVHYILLYVTRKASSGSADRMDNGLG